MLQAADAPTATRFRGRFKAEAASVDNCMGFRSGRIETQGRRHDGPQSPGYGEAYRKGWLSPMNEGNRRER